VLRNVSQNTIVRRISAETGISRPQVWGTMDSDGRVLTTSKMCSNIYHEIASTVYAFADILKDDHS